MMILVINGPKMDHGSGDHPVHGFSVPIKTASNVCFNSYHFLCASLLCLHSIILCPTILLVQSSLFHVKAPKLKLKLKLREIQREE